MPQTPKVRTYEADLTWLYNVLNNADIEMYNFFRQILKNSEEVDYVIWFYNSTAEEIDRADSNIINVEDFRYTRKGEVFVTYPYDEKALEKAAKQICKERKQCEKAVIEVGDSIITLYIFPK